jgi:hypothetical protein
MMTIKALSHQRRYSALTYRKLSERTAILYGRELDRLNGRFHGRTTR